MVGASPSTVLSWVDRGWLPAHRTPGGHRRIERHALVEFLRAHDMPEMAPESEPVRLLLTLRSSDIANELAKQLRAHHSDWRVDVSEGVVGTLAQLFESPPDALVLDATLDGVDTCVLCRELAHCAMSARVRLIVARPSSMASMDPSLRECGAWAILDSPTSPQAIVDTLSLGTLGLANAG
jgi:excisionase family DNA binding protein